VTIWLIGGIFADQFHVLTETLPASLSKLQAWVAKLGFSDQLKNWRSAVSSGSGILSTVSHFASSAANAFANILIVIFGGIFIAAEPKFYRAGMIKLIPPDK